MAFQNDGCCTSRASTLIGKIKQENVLKDRGKLLDVGCGTGIFLGEFNKNFSQWELYGQEYDERLKSSVLEVNGVNAFYTSDDKITINMNCIVMNHVLELMTFPVETLLTHHNLLEDSGIHFVQVPNYLNDPFDLCIVDQFSHFTSTSLDYLAKKCGYSIISTTAGWTQKHIGWIATKSTPTHTIQMDIKTVELAKDNVQNIFKWLNKLPHFVLEYSKGKKLGILGTTSAALWVAESINNENTCFMDEDPYRQGKELSGKIIYAPIDCPNGFCIFLPFAPKLAEIIQERLQKKYPQIDFFYFDKELLR